LGHKNRAPESKNASRDPGVPGFGRYITQEILYAGRHFLSSERLKKVGWGGGMTEEKPKPAAFKSKAATPRDLTMV